ncbi:MAG TPA: hypothetical protein VI685_09355 [Candidatus Angelobacter sp.]
MTNRTHTSRLILSVALSLVAAPRVSAQNNLAAEKPTIEKIRDLRLPSAPGAVPVYYSAGAGIEPRALKYQKAITACQKWYDQQLGKHVDITLAVLNKADWEKVTDFRYPMPFNVGGWRSLPPAGVVVPVNFEDFPHSADFTDDPDLLNQNIAFHELGHLYMHYTDMEINDNFLAELYANILMAAYVRAQRPDMLVFLQGPSPKLPPERYTSLEDVDYLADDTGFVNYGWFEFQIYRMADLLLKDKPLPQLLAELKKTFNDPVQRPFREVAAKLETIRPTIAKEMGDLWKPTTIPDSPPKPCKGGAGSNKDSDLVVLNLSSKTVKVISGKDAPVDVPANAWSTFYGHPGELLKLDTGGCYVFADEPAIARISTK